MAAVGSLSQKSRLLITYSMPLVGFALVPRVEAGPKKVHPRELDIYSEPKEVVKEFVEAEPSALEKKVSKTRKFVWGFADNVQSGMSELKNVYKITGSKTEEFGKLIQTDRTFQVKVGVIATGVLGGAILAGRGRRPFRRFFYSVGLGTVAAAVCYPKCAFSVTQNGYRKLKSFVDDQRKKYSEPKPENKPSEELVNETEIVTDSSALQAPSDEKVYKEVVPSKEELLAEATVEQENAKPVKTEVEQSFWKKIPFLSQLFGEKKPETKKIEKQEDKKEFEQTEQVEPSADGSSVKKEKSPVFDGDHGQSNPEDKDMYSTRS